MKNIVLIGGHSAPAIAIAEELLVRIRGKIHIIGRKYAFDQSKNIPSFEYEEFQKMPVTFHAFEAVRYTGIGSLLRFMLKTPIQVWRAHNLLLSIHPDVIISFGGYLSTPLLLVCILRKIPFIVHEQTPRPGKSNLIFSYFAKAVCVSWEESVRYFPKTIRSRIIVTGNPVRNCIVATGSIDSSVFKIPSSAKKLIYITGGSTGSHVLNLAVLEAIEQLVKEYRVIHQCGDSYYHDYESLSKTRDSLSGVDRENYLVKKYVTTEELAVILRHSAIVVGRSGANTVTELAVMAKPAVFIPLPQSRFSEQYILASLSEKNKCALILDQAQLSGQSLLSSIGTIIRNLETFEKNAQHYSQSEQISLHKTADSRIVDSIERSIGGVGSKYRV